MLTIEEITELLLVVAGCLFIVSCGILAYAFWLLLQVRARWKEVLRFPKHDRDVNGRPYRERI